MSKILTYPSNLADEVPSFLQIAVRNYDRKDYSENKWLEPDKFKFKGTIGKMINLPIPAGMVDNVRAGWGTDNTSNIVQKGLNQILDSNLVASVATSTSGMYGEKHIIHKFDGVSAKAYPLVWNFLPQNSNEASMVEEIIKQLKRAQLASVGDGVLALRYQQYPDMLEMKIIGKSHRHTKFLPMFITDISADRNFDDTWIEYADGFTPSIVLSLNVVEISNYTKEIFDRMYGA